MKTPGKLIYLRIALVLCVLFTACTGAVPVAESTEAPAAEAASGAGKLVILRASIILSAPMIGDQFMKIGPLQDSQLDSAKILQSILENAAAKISTDDVKVQVEIPEVRQIFAATDCGESIYRGVDQFDIYMLLSGTAPYAFQDFDFTKPEDYIKPPQFLSPLAGSAFHDESQAMLGITQATMPMMLIYNPELMLQNTGGLPETVTLDEFIEIAQILPITIPSNAAVALALSQSMFGDGLNENMIFDTKYFDSLMGYSEKMDYFFNSPGVSASNPEAILQDFIDQKIAWTISTSGFLYLLAQKGYNGPLGVRSIPFATTQGGLSMAVGWAVPGKSEYPDLAWRMIEQVIQDPEMLRWSAANGMLPVTNEEFERLSAQPDWIEGLLPLSIFGPDPTTGQPGINTLRFITSASRPWQAPLVLSQDQYNRLEPYANELVRRIANKELTYSAGIQEAWQRLIEEKLVNP